MSTMADDHQKCDQHLRAEVADPDEDRFARLRPVRLQPRRDERVETREPPLLGNLVGDGEERPCACYRQGESHDAMEAEIRSRV